MDVLPQFMAFSPVRLTDEQRSEEQERYTAYLKPIDTLEPIKY